MPVTEALPEPWYETPNIHLCTVKDFIALTRDCGIEIEDALVLNDRQHRASLNTPHLANLFGKKAIFRLTRDSRRVSTARVRQTKPQNQAERHPQTITTDEHTPRRLGSPTQ